MIFKKKIFSIFYLPDKVIQLMNSYGILSLLKELQAHEEKFH